MGKQRTTALARGAGPALPVSAHAPELLRKGLREEPREISPEALPETRTDADAALPAGLYITATPIGNAGDITLRALATLRQVAAIACEDTRVTARLLERHGLRVPLVAYHEHNAARVRPRLIARMQAGEALALVSDAGTPLISDPGYKLVQACREALVPVTALPGPSAPLTALVLSGLPSDRFLFAGFLPNRSGARQRTLAELAEVPATLIVFESAQRLPDSLADMVAILGERDAAVARELTKFYEEVRRGSLPELAAHYAAAGSPRGEVVVVIGPPGPPPMVESAEHRNAVIDAQLASLIPSRGVRDATKEVAQKTGCRRQDVYARALLFAKNSPP